MINRYIFPLLLIILSGCVYVLYIENTYLEIAQGIKRRVELQNYLSLADNAQKKLDTLEARVAQFPEGSTERLEKMVPDSIEDMRFIVDVEAVVKGFGLVLKDPRVEHEQSDDLKRVRQHQFHKLTFQVTTTYPVLRQLLRALEESLALRDLVRISFTGREGSDTEEPGNFIDPEFLPVDYTVTITSYTLRP
jgi:hypothetical protein